MKKWLNEIKARIGQWWPTVEPAIAVAFILAAIMIGGCSTGINPFAGTTTATWEKNADGSLNLKYASSKEQNNLHAEFNPDTGKFTVTVDKAGAQDSAVAALLQAQSAFLNTVNQILQQVQGASKAAAISGS